MCATRTFNSFQILRSNGLTVNNSHHTKSVYNLNYVWKIDNYSFHHEKKSPLYTPVFGADINHKFRWILSLERLSEVQDKNVMGVFLNLDGSSECERAFVKYKFCIVDDDLNEDNVYKAAKIREVKRSGSWGFTTFFHIDKLSNKKWFPNDVVTIYCEATFSESENFMQTADELSSNFIPLQLDRPKRCISKDFGDLFNNQKFADVSLSANGVNYRAHKLVLAARSPVFAAMFEHNTKENETNLVEITDIEEDVVKEMLRYIYTDQCENLKDLADGLLAASDKYDLEGLKIMCEEVLINNLTVENAAKTLNLAQLHCANELKLSAINFVAVNSVEILDTANWKKTALSYPQSLMLEIFEALSRRVAAPIN